MDAIKKKITLLKEDNETMQEEIERLQEQFHHVYPVITDYFSLTPYFRTRTVKTNGR